MLIKICKNSFFKKNKNRRITIICGMCLPFEQEKLTEYTEIGVDDAENREFLRKLLKVMYDELPAPQNRK